MMHVVPFNEIIQILEAPSQEEVNMVSYFPFQDSDDTLFYYFMMPEEPLDVLNPSFYDKGDDCVDNIDEFIHLEKRKWDVIGYDGDPIYNIEGHFQKMHLQLSYEDTNFDIWQQGEGMITKKIQTPKDDIVLYSLDDFRSYLEDFVLK
jgi:hypothetical protein